jgi:hypothetical protein
VWRGPDGRFHTVFLRDAGAVFTPSALAAVREVLADVSDDDVWELVLRVQESVVEYWQARLSDEQAEAPFVDQAPPGGLIDRTVTSVAELEDVLKGVDPRWGIEVAQALEVIGDSD